MSKPPNKPSPIADATPPAINCAFIANALPEGNGAYSDGFRDALESIYLALQQRSVPVEQISDAMLEVLDAFDNNAENEVSADDEDGYVP